MIREGLINVKEVIKKLGRVGFILTIMCAVVLLLGCEAKGGEQSSGLEVVSTPKATTSEVTTSTSATTESTTESAPVETTSELVTNESVYDDGGEPELIFTSEYVVAGSELSVVLKNVENREGFSYAWKIGSKQVSKEQTYTPTEADLEKFIKVTAINGKERYTAQIYFSKLPVVYINTENKKEVKSKDTYIDATCYIQGNDRFGTTMLYDGDIQIKGRGNASWTLGEREGKKPYKIKLDTKTDLFGMGKSKHWVLLADWNDKTVTRNIITNDFSKALGMPYSMELTNVVLIFNGEYEGLYEMGEQVRIEESRVDIFDWEELAEKAAKKIGKAEKLADEDIEKLEDKLVKNLSWITSNSVTYNGKAYTLTDYVEIPSIDGGYLLEVDMYYDTISKFKTNGATKEEDDAQPVMFKSPEYAYTNSEMFSYIKTSINNFEQAVRSYTHYYEVAGESVHYSSIVDMDSLVQYWLVNEFSNNFDSMKNSLFIYQDLGGRFYFGPAWDYDLAFGNKKPDAAPYNRWQTRSYGKKHQAYQWYKYLISDPYFLLRAYELYHEKAAPYIDFILATDGQLDSLAEYLGEAGIANAKKWYEDKGMYATEVDLLRKYIKDRKGWLDKQFATVDNLARSLASYKQYNKLSIQAVDMLQDTSAEATFEITVQDAKVKKLLALVNGKIVGTFDVAEGKVTVEVNNGYIRPEGKLNVIEIFALNAEGDNLMFGSQAMKNYLVFE